MLDIIIIICCVLGGFALGKYFENRICEKGKFFQDITRYASTLKENVLGRQLELSRFNENFTKTCSRAFAEYLNEGKIRVQLSKTQKSNLSLFFDNLDCTSSQALVQHLDYHGKLLADETKSVLDREVTKAAIYGKLGMLLGAMIGILLV